MAGDKSKHFILWFNEIGMEDIPMVGGKNASLGEMYQKLHQQGISIPNGFAITAYAYRYYLKYAGIEDEIKKIESIKLDSMWGTWGMDEAYSSQVLYKKNKDFIFI